MPLTIRRMDAADFATADEILRLAFGFPGDRKPELSRYLAAQPDGWFLALRDGVPAGTGGCVDFGPFAWIGMMGVHPAFQSRGVGRAVMNRLLDFLRARGVPAIVLDASAAGKPLYDSLGFVEAGRTSLLVAPAGAPMSAGGVRVHKPVGDRGPVRVEVADEAGMAAIGSLDRAVYGADRSRVLSLYRSDFPGRILLARDAGGRVDGYLCAQRRRLGPWVARTPAAAERLLAAGLALPLDGPAEVILPDANADGRALLARSGFQEKRTNVHMRLGGAGIATRRELLYGQASFGIG